jgi:hypothetical protein
MRAAEFYRDGDIFSNTRKGLCHPVEPRKHLVLSFFKNAPHIYLLVRQIYTRSANRQNSRELRAAS